MKKLSYVQKKQQLKRLDYSAITFVDHYYVGQITLLWHRTVNDEDKRCLFCLVNADKLPYSISEKVLNNLEIITQGSKGTNLFNI